MPRFGVDNSGNLVKPHKGSLSSDFERSVFLGDAHIPYQDPDVLKLVIEFVKDFQPDRLFVLGDWVDFYDLSVFDKDPNRKNKLQRELDLGQAYLEDLVEAAPNSKRVFMQGNHEDRLRKWLWANEEIASLRGMGIEELLGLRELGFETYDYHQVYNYNGFLVKHGDLVRKHAGYTARAELENSGVSGISGHTHRLGSHHKRDHAGQVVWYEAGCVCDLEPHYTVRPNWQQGFGIGWHESRGNRFFVELIPIIKGRFIVNGTLYK